MEFNGIFWIYNRYTLWETYKKPWKMAIDRWFTDKKTGDFLELCEKLPVGSLKMGIQHDSTIKQMDLSMNHEDLWGFKHRHLCVFFHQLDSRRFLSNKYDDMTNKE